MQCEEFLKLLIDDFNGDLREHADHKRQQLIDDSINAQKLSIIDMLKNYYKK